MFHETEFCIFCIPLCKMRDVMDEIVLYFANGWTLTGSPYTVLQSLSLELSDDTTHE